MNGNGYKRNWLSILVSFCATASIIAGFIWWVGGQGTQLGTFTNQVDELKAQVKELQVNNKNYGDKINHNSNQIEINKVNITQQNNQTLLLSKDIQNTDTSINELKISIESRVSQDYFRRDWEFQKSDDAKRDAYSQELSTRIINNAKELSNRITDNAKQVYYITGLLNEHRIPPT